MNKILKGAVGITLALPLFLAANTFAKTTITELNITSDTETVHPGPLGAFTAEIDNEHLSIEVYGSNTTWLKWEEGDSSWHGFGDEEKNAYNDGTLYALRMTVLVDDEDEYEIAENPSITLNGHDYTETGNTEFNKYAWGGYAIIDLGHAFEEENPEDTWTLTYDFNGGATFNNESTWVIPNMVAVAPALNYETLVSCFDYDSENDECHPLDVVKGKQLAYVTVNGERHDLGEGDGYMFNQDTLIKYFWEDEDLVPYTLEDEEGNTILFDDLEGRHLDFEIMNFFLDMTEEELEELGIPVDEYEAGKNAILDATSDIGEAIIYSQIVIWDTDTYEEIKQGPFDITLKAPEGMPEFKYYYFVYVNDDDENNIIVEKPILATLDEDGYFHVTLQHLSGYTVVGTNTAPKAPDTGAYTNTNGTAVLLPSITGAIILSGIAMTFVTKRNARKE